MKQDQKQEKVEAIRKSAIEVIDQQRSRAEDLELPAPFEGLIDARKKLEDNRFRILVVGEAKRGKSSFVNALIGRNILPRDWDIATSQVFCVSQADQEAYRVRFEDGSATVISSEDLPKYGSQKYIDMYDKHQGAPTLKDTIRWIEVDVPIHFLPPGVSILDTPGVGGLYSEHAEITERFIPEADGVIFTLDPSAPIMQHELQFVEAILNRTRNIFFIMTKADAFSEKAISELIDRDIEILKRKFAGQLGDLRIWPISSKNLLESVDSPIGQDLVDVSGYRELIIALQDFLFEASGCSRARQALKLSRQFQATGAQVLLSRRAALKQEDEQQQLAYQQQQQGKTALFEREWGQSGDKFNSLMDELRKHVRIAMQSLNQQIAMTGKIGRDYEARIKNINSIEAANALGKEISTGVPREASFFWRETCESTQQHCADLLEPFVRDCAVLLPDIPGEAAGDYIPSPECKENLIERARNSAGYGLVTLSVLSLGSLVAAPLVALASIAMFFSGWRLSRAQQLNQARQSLRNHLSEVILSVRKMYLEVDSQQGRQSLAEEYFGRLERVTKEKVISLSKAKADEARQELQRIAESMKLDQTRRRQEYEKLSLHIAAWDQLGKRQEDLLGQLNAMSHAAAAAAHA